MGIPAEAEALVQSSSGASTGWDTTNMPARVLLTLMLCGLLAGCGGDSSTADRTEPIKPEEAGHVGSGAAVARCKDAVVGRGAPPEWRRKTTFVGPVGFFGPNRDFRRVQGGRAKTPVVVEGRNAVTVAIDPIDLDRAGLVVASARGVYATIRLVPCLDRARTAWPAGFTLRDTDPVGVVVRRGRESAVRGEVGRP